MDRTAGWVFASVAVVAAAVLRVATRDDEHSTAWLIGGVIGSIVAGVLIGLLLRFGYVKLARKGHALWSPWVLVIAAVVSLIVAASRAGDGDGANETTASAQGGGESCAPPARTPVEHAPSLSGPWRSPAAAQSVVDQITGSLPDSAERATARAIVRRGEPVAALLVIEMTEEDGTEEDFFAGFESQAPGKPEDARLGDARARLSRAPDGGGALAGFSDPCAATIIFGTSPELVRELAGDLPVEG